MKVEEIKSTNKKIEEMSATISKLQTELQQDKGAKVIFI